MGGLPHHEAAGGDAGHAAELAGGGTEHVRAAERRRSHQVQLSRVLSGGRPRLLSSGSAAG